MLGLGELKKTKFYQEAFEEAFEEGKQEGKLEAASKLLQQCLSIEQIAEALSLDVETVRQAAKQKSS
ncbi:hypothetical protein [Calothrix sp. CCY 0018]|uniref:hypothetical protein n=1 Tax=Calothrix sp. CCY 0018 TaxID=3103864 RepID=UPI0039C6BFDB